MLRLSVIHIFIIGVFLITAVQSRICSKEVIKTRTVVEPVEPMSNNQQIEDENEVTPKTLAKSKRRHVNVTHTITYCCREEDDTEISINECIKDCKANCMYGQCKRGSCVCSYGFQLINNNCVQFCDLCRETNGTCMALILCQCKSGSYVGKVCPTPDEYPTTTTINYGDFRDTDDDVAFLRDLWKFINNDTLPSGSVTVLNGTDGLKNSNYTHNSTEPSTPSIPINTTAHSYDETTKSVRTTTPSLNVTQLTSNQLTDTHHVVKRILTEGVSNSQSNSSELGQGSATFRIKHNGVSILISILVGNHKCGNQDTLLVDAPSRN